MRFRRLPVVVAVLVVCVGVGLGLGGCGGGSGGGSGGGGPSGGGAPGRSAAAVERTVRAALADIARGNGRAFCAHATPAARAQLGDILHGYDCAGLVHLLGAHMSAPHREALLHARVRRVTVHGGVATVLSDAITSPDGKLRGWLNDGGTATRLVRGPGGRWLIDARRAG